MATETVFDCLTGKTFEREIVDPQEREQPRDPETGRYLPYPEDEG